MNLGAARKQAVDRMLNAGYIHAEREVELFLRHLLSKDSAWLISHEDEELDETGVERLTNAVTTRLTGKPLCYITGEQNFMGYNFKCDERALIPRPETETLTELVVRLVRDRKLSHGTFLEIGTGSGIIAICLKKYFPHSTIVATDVSSEALELAEENARSLNVELDFVESDLFEKVPPKKFEVIVANLPYIPTQKLAFVSDQILDWEPMVAIEAGEDGLKYITPFLEQLPKFLAPEGIVALEFWHTHGEPVIELVEKILPNYQVQIHKDLAGFDRYAILTPKSA